MLAQLYSSQAHAPRRVQRKLVRDDETDIRRARGEISCAECRRLKLKCDKKLPCGSCVRRGCPSICPNGTLATGQGTRFVLADTTQLHAKIEEMGQRIRKLEDALAIFQSGVSNETHPLLREELLNIKFGPDKAQRPEMKDSHQDDISDTMDALGTLTIDERGQMRYFGRSGGSEALLMTGAEMENLTVEAYEMPQISIEIARLSNAFPFGIEGGPERGADSLLKYLPTQCRAWSLCETYLEHAAWAFSPLKRDEIVDDILTPTYKYMKESYGDGSGGPQSVSYHKLAVLFLVFAVGARVDLTLEPYNSESETFYQLSRACLSMNSVFDSPEIATVQAVALMGAYHSMGGQRFTLDSSWGLISLACKLGQSHGLHRESARFDMDAKTVQRRRALFWELFSMELFFSLATGRPPSIRLSYVDCEFPEDQQATLDKDCNVLKGYYQWKYEFTKEIFSTVIELTLTAEAPSYKAVLELDRKVREKTLPPHLNVFMSPEDEKCTPSVYMRGCLLGQYRTVTLLYIHRSFFAQAMLDHPANPLRSPYAPSFLAAYQCASGVIKSTMNHFERFPQLCCRWWMIWTHLFSAAVIVGSIVTRSPSSSMAPVAFIELGLACDLFENGALQSHRARSGLPILCNLREKAFQTYSTFRSGNSTSNIAPSIGKSDYGNDELALFGGQTRVLVSKLLKSSRQKEAVSPRNGTPSSPRDDSSKSSSNSPDVHPSLVEYLSTIPTDSLYAKPSVDPPIHTSRFGQMDPFQYTAPEIQDSHWQPLGQSLGTAAALAEPYHQKNFSPMVLQNASSVLMSASDDYAIEDGSLETLNDLSMMMSGDSGIDEQWISFMKDSGLLNGNMDNSGLGFDGEPGL